jgi:hypothetical protein
VLIKILPNSDGQKGSRVGSGRIGERTIECIGGGINVQEALGRTNRILSIILHRTHRKRHAKHIVTCLVDHATNKFSLSGCSGYLLSFACTITLYKHHFIIIPLAPSSAVVRLNSGLRFSVNAGLFLPRGLSSRLAVTSCQGTISRVRRSVAPETLLINNGNVFRLSHCYSMAVRCYDLSLWEFCGFYCSRCAAMTVR